MTSALNANVFTGFGRLKDPACTGHGRYDAMTGLYPRLGQPPRRG
jgi:hypothetical protein